MIHTYLYSVLATDAFLSNLIVSNTCMYTQLVWISSLKCIVLPTGPSMKICVLLNKIKKYMHVSGFMSKKIVW